MKTTAANSATLENLMGPTGAEIAERGAVVANLPDYPDFDLNTPAAKGGSIHHLLDVAVKLTAELGRVSMPIGEVLKLGPGSVVGLDRAIAEPIDLFVQGVLFARGEVVVVEDRFAIRIQEIIDPKAGKAG
jgi:flagellar motor switch protein FliN/FliY